MSDAPKTNPVFVDEEIDDDSFEYSLEEIDAAIADLVAEGKVVDTGMREWCPRTGQYEIVWGLAPKKMH
jgi:hypothetical protein